MSRSRARKQALDILYAADLRGEEPSVRLADAADEGHGPDEAYTAVLVRGVGAERAALDDALARNAHGWSLGRMPAVDRNLLRLGAWEILYADDVPDRVAAAEAVKLARELSTDDSPSFVGGVLGAIAREKAAPAT